MELALKEPYLISKQLPSTSVLKRITSQSKNSGEQMCIEFGL